ncbi:MAG: glycerol-3-phosphate dehydrogenase [Gaiellales bacterium]|nr:glycerol-3-phosphate dehydrogenase [Gaiellales bacterium]
MRALVVGGGSWGTAFAGVLARAGHPVELACRDPHAVAELTTRRENTRYLPGIRLEDGVQPVLLDLPRQAPEAELIALALPAAAYAETAALLRLRPDALVITLAKGLDPATHRLLSEVIVAATGHDPHRVAPLSGPNHAEEIAAGQPAASVVASTDPGIANALQRALSTTRFRVYASADVRGVQLCGAAKNVIAIAAGICDGLGFGDNARSALVTRGLAEMTRLGSALGADPRTYAGLAGLGDLVATCTSRHSRNHLAGELLARGVAPEDAEREVGMVVEGLHTAPALAALAREAGVDLPITDAVCSVVTGTPIPTAIATLLARAAPAGEF